VEIFRKVGDTESRENDDTSLKVSTWKPCQQEGYPQKAGSEKQSDFHSCRAGHPSRVDEVHGYSKHGTFS
jgi:hypothetical protein